MSSLKLRILKTWVSRDYELVFQCQIASDSLPKKMHLILDLKQQSFGARLQVGKPEDASANHAFIQILRKHCPHFTIKEIRLDEANGDLWLPLLSGTEADRFWQLRLARSRPPLASLISPDQDILVSYGQKGTFTKRHKLESAPPASALVDLLPALSAQLLPGEAIEAEEYVEKEGKDTEGGEIGQASDSFSKAQRELRSRLKRKLKTILKTLEKLQKDLPDAGLVKDLETEAILLQSYGYLLRPEMIHLELDPVISGCDRPVSIEVDPDLSRGQQIERAFQKVHRARRGRQMGLQQIEQAQAQRAELMRDIASLASEEHSESVLGSLARRYQLPDLNRAPSVREPSSSKPFKTYTTSSGHSLLVGKGAHDNDALTKSARSNDYWFHAVGVSGSHVILPVTADIRQSLPPALLREAAILALHFSKFKEDLAGECYVTRKAHIKKPKGMPPGLWQINKSESVFVRYDPEEVQRLLQTVRL